VSHTGNLCPNNGNDTTTGEVNGMAFDWSSSAAMPTSRLAATGAVGQTPLAVYWPNGAVLIASDPDITGGILVMPEAGPDPGSIWCIGGGNVQTDGLDGTVTATGLTRLGTIADGKAAKGSLEAYYCGF
jgi:hypothetical protein